MDTPKTEQVHPTKDESELPREQSSKVQQAEKLEKADAGKSAARRPGSGEKSSVATKPKRENNVRKLRMERMMSKAELARRAGLSTLTIDRVEKGMPCRMDTKRKILEALGLTPSDRVKVFGEDD